MLGLIDIFTGFSLHIMDSPHFQGCQPAIRKGPLYGPLDSLLLTVQATHFNVCNRPAFYPLGNSLELRFLTVSDPVFGPGVA